MEQEFDTTIKKLLFEVGRTLTTIRQDHPCYEALLEAASEVEMYIEEPVDAVEIDELTEI